MEQILSINEAQERPTVATPGSSILYPVTHMSIAGRQVPHPELLPKLLLVESRLSLSASTHLARIRGMTHKLALLCGETEVYARRLSDAAMFHDIGHALLQAEGVSGWYEPDVAVREVVQGHTCMGELFLRNFSGSTMALAAAIARSHHECWNGTGYPDGLRGREIPLGARIVAVVHFFEENTQSDPQAVLTCHPVGAVLEMIFFAAGYYFDPMVARTFCRHAEDFLVQEGWPAAENQRRLFGQIFRCDK